MKKILAILLALMMVLVSVAALAADGGSQGTDGQQTGKTIDVSGLAEPTQAQTLVIPKKYDVQAPAGAELPPDKLTFTLTSKKVEDGPYTDETMPDMSMSAEAITGGNKVQYDVTLSIPKYEKVGVFYYEFQEADNGVAGVTYIKNKITVRVSVVQDWENNKLVIAAIAIRENGENGATIDNGKATYDLSKKVDSLDNTYEAGSLSLKKTVSGNMGEIGKVWNFTITLKAPTGKTVYSKITATPSSANAVITKIDNENASGNVIAAGDSGWTEKTINVTLTHGESIVFENIPKGVTYEIAEAEADQDGYVTTPSNAEGTIAAKTESKASFTNKKDVNIDTGVALDSAVYVLIMALALAGFVVLKIRRREDY